MTVKELIEALQQQNPDDVVFTEGCDCIGGAISLTREVDSDEESPTGFYVLICRS